MWYWHRNYLYFQITNWFWKPYNINHPWIICPEVNFLEDPERVNSNKSPLQAMWNGNNFSHLSRDQINSRWNILFPSYRSNFCSLTWIGDAVPGLVVKMSCQLPSIKLELVCRETMRSKKANFLCFFLKRKPAFL